MGEWKNDLFGCFNDMGLCVITYFAPCLTAGKNAEQVGEDCMLHGFLSALYPIGIFSRANIRGKIRERQGIEGSFGEDCFVHWFCYPCALVQEANELGGKQGMSMVRE
ncbi:cornifelin homolog A-like [Dreissena polymorpha]|uniref:cornifelin homolog A-like n=1 Tax=Dreissena polymorpha TaxID=45954 RepID=UPI002264878C|nr:cornifelin homolog A-like [Dreissena polymorpha]XP_052246145.1 cornifelin homolog A-like [Dreissena polymorpha]